MSFWQTLFLNFISFPFAKYIWSDSLKYKVHRCVSRGIIKKPKSYWFKFLGWFINPNEDGYNSVDDSLVKRFNMR